jgi:hypothetical protein
MCTEFEMLKVKVPIIFLGTVGFSQGGTLVDRFVADGLAANRLFN